MEVRIEITVGDKFIAESHIEPDDVFLLRRYPHTDIRKMQDELMVKISEAVDRAITELLTRGVVAKSTSYPVRTLEGNPYAVKGDVT